MHGNKELYLWLIRVSVWQNPPLYCKVISLQLNKLKKRIIERHVLTNIMKETKSILKK